MHDTWGLTGPQFLGLYALALIITVAVAIRRRLAARKLPPGHPRPPELSADEAAYLSGGTRRLVEAALARLVAEGALRVSRGHKPAATGQPASSSLDGHVLTAVRDRKPGEGLILATNRLHGSAELRQLRERLLRLHLLVSPERARGSRLAAAAVFAPVLLVGALRLSDGVSNGKPVGFLIFLLALTTALTLLAALLPGPRTTTLGLRALDRARSESARRRTDDTMHSGAAAPGDVVFLVAFSGLAAHPDSGVASGLATDAGGVGGGGGCGSGGGGCGGGGGGGGGGGCGG